ncbi:hypothetical protein Zmor_027915 [Zophobas morio]|uniref:Uncharacterized protein n=1 Tax=Zophobas morio TaxID=2755281 RepID=A0AA38M2I0_9CUCU|nr:hypothetical protein Zmor_027915 [Zophobas morio]
MTAGYKLTCDESTFSECGKGAHQNGMTAVIKIKRKPKGVGCEMKRLADAQTRDAWVGSVKTTVELKKKRGLYFLGIVKVAILQKS